MILILAYAQSYQMVELVSLGAAGRACGSNDSVDTKRATPLSSAVPTFPVSQRIRGFRRRSLRHHIINQTYLKNLNPVGVSLVLQPSP